MTKLVLCVLLLIAAFTVSAWFLVLIPVLMLREMLVMLFLTFVLKRSVRFDNRY